MIPDPSRGPQYQTVKEEGEEREMEQLANEMKEVDEIFIKVEEEEKPAPEVIMMSFSQGRSSQDEGRFLYQCPRLGCGILHTTLAGLDACKHNEAPPAPEQLHGWSSEETLLLIQSYKLFQDEFSDTTKKKYQVWRNIANELQKKGYTVDGAACDQKMRSLKRRYKLIKDNASLSGRGAMKQWQYFSVMDEIFAGDPSIAPEAVANCFPLASTSGTQGSQPSTSDPLNLAPSPSSSPVLSPVQSPSPSGDFTIHPPPQKRFKRSAESSSMAEVISHQGKVLENLVSCTKDRSSAMTQFLSSMTAPSKTSLVAGETENLHSKIEELYQRLLQAQTEHNNELMEVNQKHIEEIKEIQQQHIEEIKEIHQQHKEEIKEVTKQHKEEIKELKQHNQQELSRQQELAMQMQQQQQQLMEIVLRSQRQ